MEREEFLDALDALVGAERGKLRRASTLFGVNYRTMQAVSAGERRVPPSWVPKVRRAQGQAKKEAAAYGNAMAALAPRLQGLLEDGVALGFTRDEALGAIAGWAALRLARVL